MNEAGRKVPAWHVLAILREMDRRYQSMFESQKEAVSAALASSEKAVLKAEAANKSKFEDQNEFRQSLGDQARMLMPRAEAEAIHAAHSTKVAGEFEALKQQIVVIEKRLSANEGRGAGVDVVWKYLFAAIAAAAALWALISRLNP